MVWRVAKCYCIIGWEYPSAEDKQPSFPAKCNEKKYFWCVSIGAEGDQDRQPGQLIWALTNWPSIKELLKTLIIMGQYLNFYPRINVRS